MGIAEIIPGVSGGTIAFITGIYETLLDSINEIKPSLLTTIKDEGVVSAWKKLNGEFLVFLFGGMVLGILFGVLTISHLLDSYPNLVWALFFGIIFASVFYIGAQLTKWKIHYIGLFILFTALTLWITNLNPGNGSDNYFVIFGTGFIAISAFMLPGVSGSFMLLLMGMYTFIVHEHLKNLIQGDLSSLGIIAVFGLGCLAGVFSFARLLQWTFNKHRNGTLASLTGILLGSLYKIWPWRNPVLFVNKETGQQISVENSEVSAMLSNDMFKVVREDNVLPDSYYSDPQLLLSIICIAVGIGIVYLLHKMDKK